MDIPIVRERDCCFVSDCFYFKRFYNYLTNHAPMLQQDPVHFHSILFQFDSLNIMSTVGLILFDVYEERMFYFFLRINCSSTDLESGYRLVYDDSKTLKMLVVCRLGAFNSKLCKRFNLICWDGCWLLNHVSSFNHLGISFRQSILTVVNNSFAS